MWLKMYKYDMSGVLKTYSEQFAKATDDGSLKRILAKFKSELKQIKVVTVEEEKGD